MFVRLWTWSCPKVCWVQDSVILSIGGHKTKEQCPLVLVKQAGLQEEKKSFSTFKLFVSKGVTVSTHVHGACGDTNLKCPYNQSCWDSTQCGQHHVQPSRGK